MLVVWVRKKTFNEVITSSMIKKAVIQINEKTKGQNERRKEQERLIRVRKWFDEK